MKDNLFSSKDVIALYKELINTGIDIWLDGGWAVDALLGKQTRPHEDADIVIQEKDISKLRKLLESKGYKDVIRDDTSDWNFVLGDNKGHLVDIHVIVFDDKKNGIYGPKENGKMYPVDSLAGKGILNGIEVKCISPEYLVKFHSGYELQDKDHEDVLALCKKFKIDCQEEYEKKTS